MLTLMLFWSAFAGELLIDAKVPCEVLGVGNQPIAQLFWPSRVHVPLEAGHYELTVMVAGNPNRISLDLDDATPTTLVVGRTGLTTHTTATTTKGPPPTHTLLQVRSAANERLVLQLDGKRHTIGIGQELEIELPLGDHTLRLRTANGTTIFATGSLQLDGAGPLIIQVSEGRMPEFSGEGGIFSPSSGG